MKRRPTQVRGNQLGIDASVLCSGQPLMEAKLLTIHVNMFCLTTLLVNKQLRRCPRKSDKWALNADHARVLDLAQLAGHQRAKFSLGFSNSANIEGANFKSLRKQWFILRQQKNNGYIE